MAKVKGKFTCKDCGEDFEELVEFNDNQLRDLFRDRMIQTSYTFIKGHKCQDYLMLGKDLGKDAMGIAELIAIERGQS